MGVLMGLNVKCLLWVYMFETHGAQVGALCEKVRELLGSVLCVGGVGSWRQALRVDSLTLLPVLCPCFLCADEM